MPTTTPRLGITVPSTNDSNNIPIAFQQAMALGDQEGAVFSQGTAASRPTAAVTGRFYWATDTQTLSYDNGTAWTTINASLATLLQNKGDLFVASAAGAAARLAAGADGQALVARAAATNGVDWESQLGQPLNLPGTGSATRFVGGTVNGPPTTGTFAVGDFVITQAGNVIVCTAAGTPGTWVTANQQTLPYKIISRQPSDQVYAPAPSAQTTMNYMQAGPASAFTTATKCTVSAQVLYAGGHSMFFQVVAFNGTTPTKLWPLASGGEALIGGGAGLATVASGGSVTAFQWNITDLPVTLPAGTTSVAVQWGAVDRTDQVTTTDAHLTLTFGMY